MLTLLGLSWNEINDLMLGTKFVLQGGDVHLLNIDSIFRSHGSSDAGGVAGDHPDAFQAQRAESDVGIAGGPRDEEIDAFGWLRSENAIRNLIRIAHAPDAAFIDELIFVQSHALHMMTVDEMAAHADAVELAAVGLHVLLPHDIPVSYTHLTLPTKRIV